MQNTAPTNDSHERHVQKKWKLKSGERAEVYDWNWNKILKQKKKMRAAAQPFEFHK